MHRIQPEQPGNPADRADIVIHQRQTPGGGLRLTTSSGGPPDQDRLYLISGKQIGLRGCSMTANDKPAENEMVACEICLKEIPVSEAKSEEATDYVLYFCGIDCYEQWKQQADEKTR